MRVEEVETPQGKAYEKRLAPRERAEAEAARRLRDEAFLLRALAGTVAPRLLEAGEDEAGPWLRTAALPFPTLAARLAAAPAPMVSAWIERAGRTAFEALALLHGASDAAGPLAIVHADLSPANVALDDAGERAAFLDLELACWRGGGAGPRADGAFRGTILYAAPEVARGELPDARSDLFSLAASLLHAATGSPARRGPSLAVLLAAAAEEPILDGPGGLDPAARRTFAERGPVHAAILACLAHAPSGRPAGAEALGLC